MFSPNPLTYSNLRSTLTVCFFRPSFRSAEFHTGLMDQRCLYSFFIGVPLYQQLIAALSSLLSILVTTVFLWPACLAFLYLFTVPFFLLSKRPLRRSRFGRFPSPFHPTLRNLVCVLGPPPRFFFVLVFFIRLSRSFGFSSVTPSSFSWFWHLAATGRVVQGVCG